MLILNAEHQAQAAENAVEPAHSAVASENNTPAQSKPVAPTVKRMRSLTLITLTRQ